jgi:hypothetical protein
MQLSAVFLSLVAGAVAFQPHHHFARQDDGGDVSTSVVTSPTISLTITEPTISVTIPTIDTTTVANSTTTVTTSSESSTADTTTTDTDTTTRTRTSTSTSITHAIGVCR